MTNIISLQSNNINSSTAVKLLSPTFTYGWRNMTAENPSNSTFGTVESQFSGWENPMINLQFYIPIDQNISGYMTWALWNQFAKNQYDGTSATRLYLSAEFGNSVPLATYAASSLSTSTYPIPVQIKSYSLNITADESRNGYLWVITAQLTETK